MIFVGDDWAEAHHDVYLCDEAGNRLGKARLPEGIEGIGRFHELIAGHAGEPADVVVGIETDRGLWVQALVEAGYRVYAINPRAASRYRDRHTLSGAKSDPGDAKLLAELVRTDRHNHRPVAGDSDLGEGIKVLARAHQNLIWDRTRATNRLRCALREYFPAALDTFAELADRDTLSVLAVAPDPVTARKLTPGRVRTLLRNAGRQRNIEVRAHAIVEGLRAETLTAPPAVVSAFAATTRAQVALIAELNTQIAGLETELAAHFEQHPDADIYLSQPGIGVILGARVLGEFGDDPNRYADAKSRKNYAGTSPITRASGTRSVALARFVRNARLADAIDQWAFCALTNSSGARAFYDHRRDQGDSHHKALRALGNRLVGILHGCLRTHTTYDETIAWSHRQDRPDHIAA
ncbi:MAG TPA: IS110 family transposase [Microthrixaceae bacterium]|nr:IS110 family transposase [Microthrixaceae bacterium]HMX67138.1 IS110 family transposase [Microthrixaceae bacterium]HNE38091.1 IS110 family transposase [Microthrixaceae bacterium]